MDHPSASVIRANRRTVATLIATSAVLGPFRIPSSPAVASEATPAPLGFEIAPGVTAEEVAPPEGSPALSRIQIAAGSFWQASSDTDPGIGLVFVESGALDFAVEASIAVYDNAMPRDPATIASGTFSVTANHYFVAPPFTAATITNPGTAPATFLLAMLSPVPA